MSKSRIDRLEHEMKPKQVDIILVYEHLTEDYMEIRSLNFEGKIEDGKKFMKTIPNSLFVIHHVPDEYCN